MPESGFEMSVREFLARPPFFYRNIKKEHLELFSAALTHDSYAYEAADGDPPRAVESYERLEFLGDAVLELAVCEYVYSSTDLREGKMTDFKQSRVSNHMISERILSYGLDIDSRMRVGNGHVSDGKNRIEENMRSDSFEALLGAIYVSYGLDESKRIINEIILHDKCNYYQQST
ncbi:MAG: hypothetical protein J5494_06315 [Candidatus Methanomethylophilaceae archaeon]|nr:hypothetical protein [Candidatus Methanomethylophilaceae archaeon]